MSASVGNSERVRSWPLTQHAWERLVDECAQLRVDLTSLTGQGLEEGIVRLPVARKSRRLETLARVLDQGEIVRDASCAAIGRRAILRDESGAVTVYEIVCPGDGNPEQGRISADSPLGTALLGARAGDVVEVAAPRDRWTIVVVAIE